MEGVELGEFELLAAGLIDRVALCDSEGDDVAAPDALIVTGVDAVCDGDSEVDRVELAEALDVSEHDAVDAGEALRVPAADALAETEALAERVTLGLAAAEAVAEATTGAVEIVRMRLLVLSLM